MNWIGRNNVWLRFPGLEFETLSHFYRFSGLSRPEAVDLSTGV
jgi:hypothetical protein